MDARYREKGRGEEVLVCMLPHAADLAAEVTALGGVLDRAVDGDLRVVGGGEAREGRGVALVDAADGVDVSASMFGRVFCTGLTRASGLVARRSRARSAHA